jgi:penicillin amidase
VSAVIVRQSVRERVTVRRDERGVPFIEAANDDDLFFAQGYVTASDRLWQMDLLRRTARGEVSELLGADMLDEDKHFRVYGFGALAQRAASRLDSGTRAAFEHYARGVNAFIAGCTDATLPLEFRLLGYRPAPWSIADSLVIGKLLAEALSSTWEIDVMRAGFVTLPSPERHALLVERSPLDVVVVGDDAAPRPRPPSPFREAKTAPAGAGLEPAAIDRLVARRQARRRALSRVGLYARANAASNSWVLAGKHAASGKPLLANDPHLAPSAPSIWYMSHLVAPGLRVAGVTVPGAPGIILGRNEHIAWGCTNLGGDEQDVFRETFDGQQPGHHRVARGWEALQTRDEAIRVRRSPSDPACDVTNLTVTVTRNGPVVFESNGVPYSLRWTALDEDAIEFAAFLAINRARNWQQFRQALAGYTGPSQNFIYADVDGHIGYSAAGRIPIRAAGDGDGSLPGDGAEAQPWRGFLTAAELPHLLDPADGMIVTANNRIVGQSYPHYLTHGWAEPYRARRILELLQAGARPATAAGQTTIQGDTYSFADAIFTRELVALARAHAADSADWAQILATFGDWDARASAAGWKLSLAHAMHDAFWQKVLPARLGAERAAGYAWWPNRASFFDSVETTRPAEWLPPAFASYDALLLACYQEARATLSARFGPDPQRWSWERVAPPITFAHPLAAEPRFHIAPIPEHTGGSGATVNAGGYVSMRMVVDLGDDELLQGIALGQSGDPQSRHWSDQLASWRTVKPGAFAFSPKAVRNASQEQLILEPGAATG